MHRPAAVLWDMDGTLIDTEPYWMAAETEVVEAYGGTWTDEDARALVGADLIDAARQIAERASVPLPPEAIVERLLDGVISRLHQGTPWRPGARELLAELVDAGVPCALVTMSWRRFVDPVIAQLPHGSFAAIVTGDEIDNGKPHPAPYLRAAALLGVEPADCVAIEDSPTGVRSALAAGCRVLGVPNVRSIDRQPGVMLAPTLEGVDLARLSRLRTAEDDRRVRSRRSAIALLIGIVALGITALVVDRRETAVPPVIPLDVWAPYWTLSETTAELPGRLTSLREVSPFWYRATGVEDISVNPYTDAEEAADFLAMARDAGAYLVPSVVDAMPAGGMAAILIDPVTRSRHVDTLVEFVLDGDFDGLDIDYEQFAFADGRDTWATTRPAWVAFVTELADRLHAQGRTLTVSIPPVYDDQRTADSGYWVYDHGAIAEVVDNIRIMAYDYSTSSPGPIAPLEFVERAVAGTASVVDDRSRLVLGIPVYGYNWPISTVGECPDDAPRRTSVTARSVHELLERRGGTPIRDDLTGEWSFTYELELASGGRSCVQTRQVNFVDGDGALERIEIARRAGFGGVALWALGYEDDGVWDVIASAIRSPDDADTASDLSG